MDPNLDALHHAQLVAAIETIITALHCYKQEYPHKDIRVAVIGGLAVRHYLGQARVTCDADILVTRIHKAQDIKQFLKGNTVFSSDSNELKVAVRGSYKTVDLMPLDALCPFENVPSSFFLSFSVPIQNVVQPGQLPYISELDLLLSKIISCGVRASVEKSVVDGLDADGLAADCMSRSGSFMIPLTPVQAQIAQAGLPSLVHHSMYSMSWWKGILGLA